MLLFARTLLDGRRADGHARQVPPCHGSQGFAELFSLHLLHVSGTWVRSTANGFPFQL